MPFLDARSVLFGREGCTRSLRRSAAAVGASGAKPVIFQAEFHKQRSYSYLWATLAIFHPAPNACRGPHIWTAAFSILASIQIRVVLVLWRSFRPNHRTKSSLMRWQPWRAWSIVEP